MRRVLSCFLPGNALFISGRASDRPCRELATILRPMGTLSLVLILLSGVESRADEGGVSLWLPGQFGSLAAVPEQPGWALATIYYHADVGAGGSVSAARQITIGNLSSAADVNLN